MKRLLRPAVFGLALSQTAVLLSAFGTTHGVFRRQFQRPGTWLHTPCLAVSTPENGINDKEETEEDVHTEIAPFDLEEDEEDNEQELILEFIAMVQTTPIGELDLDEVDLLREIMAEYKTNDVVVEGVEAAQVLENLLFRLIREWKAARKVGDEEKESAFCPNSNDFDLVFSAWQDSDNPDKVIRVLSLLSDQREIFLDTNGIAPPQLSTIKTVMSVLSDSRERGIDRHALQVFESINEFGLAPDPDLYSQVITIVAKSRAPRAPERAEKLLKEAVEKCPPQLADGKFTGIGADAFNAIIVGYAKGNYENGPERAQELIAYMDQVEAESGSLGICSPNAKTFTSLIDAYCQQNEWDSVSQADRILNRLLGEFLDGNDDLEPTVATWTIVINAWGRLSRKNRHGAADRAGRLLRRMEELNQEGRISARPDAIAYVTCMNAYAFTKGGEDAGEAEKLLEEMNERYLDGDDTMKPSARSVKVITEAWVKQGDMQSAEEFLDDYEDYLFEEDDERTRETVRDTYRTMLFGYTQENNVERARFYLDYMFQKGFSVDNMCFERLIEAQTRAERDDSLKQSLEVFEIMEQRRKEGKLQPNERVYTTFIRAMTKGRAPQMYKKAEVLLKRMKKFAMEGNEGLKPTIFTYNAVLNACAESFHGVDEDLDEAFRTAVKVFTELRNHPTEEVDHVTFGNLLRCALLVPEGTKREKFVSATFRLCSEMGCVSNTVLRDLQLAAPEKLWRDLLDLPEGEPSEDSVPSSWSFRLTRNRPRSQDFARGNSYRKR